jgi:hypothetical protein
MDVKELVSRGTDKVVAVYCGKCGLVYRLTERENVAEECCKPKKCSSCGKLLEEKYYFVCEECRDKKVQENENALFEKAKKVAFRDYQEEMVYYEGLGHDGYVMTEDIEEDIAGIEGPKPKYVWACKRSETPKIDASDIIERYFDDYAEETIDGLDVEGLQKALDQWLGVQDVNSFEIDYEMAVILPGD